MDWLKCNICFNTYNESCLRPRSLTCGHTFCERCLNITVQNETITCPQCRKIHELNSVLDLPINFIVEGLSKFLNSCSQDVNEGAMSSPIGDSDADEINETQHSLKSLLEQQERSLSAQKELLKTSAGLCNDHPSKECMFRCSLHMCWVCNQCIEDQGYHPKHKCKIISYKEEIEVRKQDHKRSIEEEGKSCDETTSVIEKHISFLKKEKERHLRLLIIRQDLVELHKKEEENLENEIVSFQNVIEKGKILKQSLQNVEATVLNTVTLDDSNTARDLVKDKKEVDDGKLKMEYSNSLTMTTERSLENIEKDWMLQQELQENIKESGQIESEGVECRRHFNVGESYYSCLQCREDDEILCGSCFVNSAHVNHNTKIQKAKVPGGYCDCGISESWKRHPTRRKHLRIDDSILEPFDARVQASSKCKEVFFKGEKCYTCLDCGIEEDPIICGSCFLNSSHRDHRYMVYTINCDGAFCDCGNNAVWTGEATCRIHN